MAKQRNKLLFGFVIQIHEKNLEKKIRKKTFREMMKLFFCSKTYIYQFYRFGVGKKQMENICLEELNYVNEEIRNTCGKPFDVSVRIRIIFIFSHNFDNTLSSILVLKMLENTGANFCTVF